MKRTDMPPPANRTASLREVFLLRERARNELRLFVASVRGWPERARFQHFYSYEDRKLWTGWDKEKLKELEKTGIWPEGYVSEGQTEKRECVFASKGWRDDEPGSTQSKKYLATFFSMLQLSLSKNLGSPFQKWSAATNRNKAFRVWYDARENELQVLLRLLNEPTTAVEWEIANGKISTSSHGPRRVAERLITYLNLISECGPVHGVCKDCGTMFIREKERKLCHDCSRKHQTYEYRKEYLLQKKREYYRRDADNNDQ